ncbi:helix-turn-helix domain-containing protein [Renibacterium salmoninarum]|uniref:helix-turn-helix domain-containing protein n=1 Tax=Renibacterium salmoninarum TaxID=1646 RepID=UPI0009B59F14|nr:helix-turn-helix domain-containing protein [Renibacterium salmoninarum]
MKALSSPLRLRILRLCLHQARTNKEIAELLEANPASILHHVRKLVDTGFLAPQELRRGTRGAREVPYLATRRSFSQSVPDASPILINAFLEEIKGLHPSQIETSRLGLHLNQEHREEMLSRFNALLREYAEMPSDPDSEPTGIMFAHRVDQNSADPEQPLSARPAP